MANSLFEKYGEIEKRAKEAGVYDHPALDQYLHIVQVMKKEEEAFVRHKRDMMTWLATLESHVKEAIVKEKLKGEPPKKTLEVAAKELYEAAKKMRDEEDSGCAYRFQQGGCGTCEDNHDCARQKFLEAIEEYESCQQHASK